MIATALRVANQLRRDPPTLALLLIVPAVLMTLVRYLLSERVFEVIGPLMLGVFPFIVMFAVTAVTMLRERTGGTLERLLAMPLRKLDLLLGYAVTFGVVAVVQSAILITWSTVLGLGTPGVLLVLVALLDGVLGMALGLFVSVFARTEFQVAQMIPAFVLPQVLLSGVFGPREQMADVLRWISDVLPMTYAVDAASRLVHDETLTGEIGKDLVYLAAATLLALVLAASTLRRQTD